MEAVTPLMNYEQASKTFDTGQYDGLGFIADTEELKRYGEQMVHDGFATHESGDFYALTEKGMQWTREHWGNGKDSPQVPPHQARFEDDELYQICKPILALNPERAKAIEEDWEQLSPSILTWAVKSGYFLWARQQPKPLDARSVLEWLKHHRADSIFDYKDSPKVYQHEKQVRGVKVSKKRPFLERYYVARRLLLESVLMQQPKENRRPLLLMEQAITHAIACSRKYLFTDSAITMIATLLEGASGTSIKTLPETHLFIEFASPIDLGVYEPIHGLFFQSLSLTIQGLTVPLDPSIARLQQSRVVTLLNEQGNSIMSLVYEPSYQAWRLAELHNCPESACKQLATPQEMLAKEMFTNWQACDRCKTFATFWSRWFPVALLAIQGEFAEDAEPVEREITKTIIRKEKRPNSGKYDERREEAHFKIVTFDASVRRIPALTPSEKVSPEGPTWLDLAIEQGTVVYVKRGFGTSMRHLDPERNSRWKFKREVTVRGYEKKIPMTVANLQRIITKVTASKYEQGKQS